MGWFGMLRFFVLFMTLLIGLFSLRITNVMRDWVTVPVTGVLADISAFLIKLFDKDVVSYGVIIQSQSNGFAVQIAPGCDGIEAVIILVSAIVAFPSPWKHKLVGIAVGFVAIQALNLVRIISLFYLGQWNQTWFEWFHLYLWQALIILDALAVWLIWLRYLPRSGRGMPPPSPTDGAAQPA
jgi:exosortase H (IPTLxxWG-CTERM-specific)